VQDRTLQKKKRSRRIRRRKRTRKTRNNEEQNKEEYNNQDKEQTERLGRVVRTPSLHSGGPDFKSLSGYRVYWPGAKEVEQIGFSVLFHLMTEVESNFRNVIF
jgi:hypothetical protein